MQFGKSFSALLTSVVVALLASNPIEALPIQSSGMVHLPLQRAHQLRSDVHPQILLQQHINRAHKRLARMTGAHCPSDEEMEAKLHKRMFLTPGYNKALPVKRYNSYSAPTAPAPAAAKTNELAVSDDTETPEDDSFADSTADGAEGDSFADSTADGSSDGFTAAKDPNSKNTLGLDIIAADVGYFATIQVGTPPRDFKVIMDSGSADLWLGAEDCQSQNGGGCGNHVFLGAQSSSSFSDSKTPFKITYGTGEVEGTQVTDNLNLAGLSLPNHKFGVAQLESQDFSDDSVVFDGLMGLALSTLSTQNTLTPVEALASSGLVKNAIVSYKISRLKDDKNDGQITFGGLDTSKFDPKTLVTIDNASQNGFWEAPLQSVTVNGKDIGIAASPAVSAILDTGTTVIVAPQADAEALHALIPGSKKDGQGGFIIPCQTDVKVAMKFGGKEFAIDTRDLAFAQLSNDPQGDCVSGISSGNFGGGNSWLVGDVFLKNAYFSTDATKNQLSLAQLV